MATVTSRTRRRVLSSTGLAVAAVLVLSGCQWRGLNSLPLPGTEGSGEGSYSVDIQLAQINGIEQNSRVRVNDVNVGNISHIKVESWHALVTVRLNGDVVLPANVTAKIGQTSLLGTQHIELSLPTDAPQEGRLQQGDLITVDKSSVFPTTEQTLAALSLVLNGGGLGNLQEINQQLGEALSGRENTTKALLANLDEFTARLDDQRQDIIDAMNGLNNLAETVDQQKGILARGLEEIPKALTVLNAQQTNISNALLAVGNLADQADQITVASKQDLLDNLQNLAPALRALADNGPNLTASLDLLATYPWPENNVQKFIKGDYANLSAVIDLTASRIDEALLTGTQYEGQLSNLEKMLGRTVGLTPRVGNDPLSSPLNGAGQ